MIEVSDLKRQFNSGQQTVKAVNGVNLKVSKGQFVSIIGKSGSGKSTLLSLLGGLDKPSSGQILVNDTDITKLKDSELINYRCKTIGFIFQSYNLVPNLSAIENVMLPMEFAKVNRQNRIDNAVALLTKVGLSDQEIKRKPTNLSGGQQQRVAIARALANQPELILADEPTGNLDTVTGQLIIKLLKDLSKSQQTTIIIVTHDSSISSKTDRTYTLVDGKVKK